MKVMITGATGLIGNRLAELYEQPVLTSRSPEAISTTDQVIGWPVTSETLALSEPVEAIFHLAGEPVAGARWSSERMNKIRDSRVEGTRGLVDWIGLQSVRPKVFVCASAIGFYGDRGDEFLTEESEVGTGFLAEVCRDWESEAMRARAFGVRVVCVRIGIVLNRHSGALAEMITPFKLGVGGPLGSGKQWMSWIHLDDVVGLLRHVVASPVEGPINAVSPAPATNHDFSKTLASVLNRPSFLRAPAFALKLALGKMSDIVLASQRVSPKAALESGYVYRYTELGQALSACLEE